MSVREIVEIDEEKCDGCELCIPSCAEGAIQMINGKAKLVDDSFCDGLGACLGECPQDAITITKRDADEFDESAVEQHLTKLTEEKLASAPKPIMPLPTQPIAVCPGSLSQSLKSRSNIDLGKNPTPGFIPSQLANWPVQLHLVPIKAPYFDECDLLIAADCVPFANANFHDVYLKNKVLVIGCPKLDDVNHYHQKLSQLFNQNEIKSIEIVYMEVPCCFGLAQLVKTAIADSGKEIPLYLTKVGIRGEEIEKVQA